jgi:hypothetical protein
MNVYNLAHGGDRTDNANYAKYPQNIAGAPGSTGKTLLHPEYIMHNAHYGLTRDLNFCCADGNCQLQEFYENLWKSGNPLKVGDDLIVLTIPHMSTLKGFMYRVCGSQATTSFEVIHHATGVGGAAAVETVLGVIDATNVTSGWIEVEPSMFTDHTTNDFIKLRIVTWPAPAANQPIDNCGIFDPCPVKPTLCLSTAIEVFHPFHKDCDCPAAPCGTAA